MNICNGISISHPCDFLLPKWQKILSYSKYYVGILKLTEKEQEKEKEIKSYSSDSGKQKFKYAGCHSPVWARFVFEFLNITKHCMCFPTSCLHYLSFDYQKSYWTLITSGNWNQDIRKPVSVSSLWPNTQVRNVKNKVENHWQNSMY